jgi:hypothetical protein
MTDSKPIIEMYGFTKEAVEAFIEKVPFSACWIWSGRFEYRGKCPVLPMKGEVNARRVYFALCGHIPMGKNWAFPICGDWHCMNPAHAISGPLGSILSRVKKNGGCWEIPGPKESYPSITFPDGAKESCHRFMYRHKFGEVPEGMYVCHRCDNRRCVNPSHLFSGTQKDNIQDAVMKGRLRVSARSRRAILSRDKVIQIKSMLSNGVKRKDIALKFGVSPYTITSIRIGKTWKTV